ncbi:HDOD domain-containing protein [Saccharospirillum salsuginis]|uniref:HDOD domain-containing protein n=1 Tax=Saccharospirillum salsuginis TaxID=418750 RepID=A0A918KMT6_9GAMM|nr:HDOD domain-containing protein [Saccharospirillum salsuginis]GGX69749.1 HDOD domain-containing protein [Saccharospirillum salsuginis]
MSTLVETVKQDIIDALNNDQLVLPSLPEVALQVRETAEDPEATIADLTQIISRDGALSARIIRVVNSPLLRAPQEVRDLAMAVSRLGMNYTSNLAIGLAMEQMFQATTDMIDKRMRQLWRLTGQVSAMASVLARHSGIAKPDEAILAALIHRLGALPILTYAEERDDLIQDNITLGQVIDQLHGGLGGVILEKWDFPSNLCQVPREYRKFDREPDEGDLTDLITVANLIVLADSTSGWARKDWEEVTAFARLRLPADREDPIFAEFTEKAAEAQAAFL